jgi:hypothetical protein
MNTYNESPPTEPITPQTLPQAGKGLPVVAGHVLETLPTSESALDIFNNKFGGR